MRMLTTEPREVRWWVAVLGGAMLALMAGNAAYAQDVPGSQDHPFIGRQPHAIITFYQQQESATYDLVLGPLPSDDASVEDIERRQPLEGRVTRIQYKIGSGSSAADIYHQYGYAIRRGKLDELAVRKGPGTRGPGGSRWLRKVMAPLGEDAVNALVVSTVPQQRRFYAGRQVRKEGEVYLVLIVNQHADKDVRVHLDIIEVE